MTREGPLPMSDLERRRRKRTLSEEERALWESVAGQVKPLRKKPRPLTLKAGESTPEKPARAAPALPPRPATAAKGSRKPALPPLLALARRERSRLSRGSSKIDARIDLHGLSQARAHRALLSFLQAAQADGLTFVLVITGKGSGEREGERGVLRRQVPHWLSLPEFRALVVGVTPAHLYHGGEGALYLRIRRFSPSPSTR